MQKLIITACISSYEANKTLNPAVPYTVEEFVREAKSAYEAGAAIVHLHPREDDGALTQSPERYKALMNAIVNECPGVILQPATGGDAKMSVEERFQPLELDPEIATLDCGTGNFGGDDIFVNTENTIIKYANQMKSLHIKQELEVSDKGMMDMAVHLNVEGCIPYPMHFNIVLGATGGIAATPRDLAYMVDSLPRGSTWTVSGMGKKQFAMAVMAIIMGGHVRVGFENSIYSEEGVLARSNGELVSKVARLAKELGRQVASPSEAREILGIRGKYS